MCQRSPSPLEPAVHLVHNFLHWGLARAGHSWGVLSRRLGIFPPQFFGHNLFEVHADGMTSLGLLNITQHGRISQKVIFKIIIILCLPNST